MPTEFDTAMKNAATSVAKYIEDAAIMQVETRYVEIGPGGAPDFESSSPVARTIVRLDGDSETILPVRKNQSGALEVDAALFELHQQNVNTAIEYRARILSSLLSTLLPRRGGA